MKEEYVDISNSVKNWNFGVYPSLLEFSIASFSTRPLRQAGLLLPVLETSFASATCALAAFQIENMLRNMSGRYQGDKLENLVKKIQDPQRRAAILELSVVRDAVAHGHLYKTSIILDNDSIRKSLSSLKLTRYYSAKANKKVVRNKTKILKLNVNPSRISFLDAVAAVALVNIVYKEVENRAVDMPINRYVIGRGYDDKCPHYFGAYIQYIICSLDTNHKRSVNSKLRMIAQL